MHYAALWKVIKSNSPELATSERSRRCPKAKAPRLPERASIFTSQTFIAPIEYDFVIEGNRSRDRYRILADSKYVAPASVDSRHRYFHTRDYHQTFLINISYNPTPANTDQVSLRLRIDMIIVSYAQIARLRSGKI